MATLRMMRMRGRRAAPWASELASVVRQAFLVIALGVIAVYAFFVALGAIDPGDVAGVTIAVLLLVGLWLVRSWSKSRRHADERDPRLAHERERRGF